MNGFAIVSDKRCYFQGTSYEITYKNNGRKKSNKTNRSRTVDLKDITGTGFDYIQNILYIIKVKKLLYQYNMRVVK